MKPSRLALILTDVILGAALLTLIAAGSVAVVWFA